MDQRDSNVGLTVKDMVTELYGDMKIVRPIAEKLDAADLPRRVLDLETRNLVEDTALKATAKERGRIVGLVGGISNKSLAVLFAVLSLLQGIWVAYATHLKVGP